jgi:hypothetical protein
MREVLRKILLSYKVMMNVLKQMIICAMSVIAFSYAMEAEDESYKNQQRLAEAKISQLLKELIEQAEWRRKVYTLEQSNKAKIHNLREPHERAEREIYEERDQMRSAKL